MQGKFIFKAAKLMGISQSAIAAALGLHRSAVYRWANDIRPIPQRYVPGIMQIVAKALMECQNTLSDSDHPQDWLNTPRGMDVMTLLITILSANWEYHHHKAYQEDFRAAIETLAALSALSPAELRQPANATRLAELGQNLAAQGDNLLGFGPLYDLLDLGKYKLEENRDAAVDGHRDASEGQPCVE